MTDLSILIVNWNTAGLLVQCLESIFKTGSLYNIEIIVVDNASSDESVSLVTQQFPSVILIRNEQNFGFARANNQGLAVGRGRYFMLLNSDTIVLPGAIDALIQAADANPQVGALGPKLLNMDGSIQKSWASFPSLFSELIGKDIRTRKSVQNYPGAFEVDYIKGACMLVRASTVEDVGKLDEDFFFYSEEVDWCFRIKEKNWGIWFLMGAEIYHLGGGSTQHGLVQLVRLYRGKLLYFSKHQGQLKTVLLRYGLAFGNSLGVVRRIVFFNWKDKEAAWHKIVSQSKLVRCLFLDQYPETGAMSFKTQQSEMPK
jgi:GT2 family glycosyltransferase